MLVAALALRIFRVLLAFIAAASSLIALGLSAALVELFDAAGASRTSWAPRRAKVLPAALVEILAVALLELTRATRSAGLAKALFLALATAALIGIVAVALLELVASAWTSGTIWRAEVLLLALAAAALIGLASARLW